MDRHHGSSNRDHGTYRYHLADGGASLEFLAKAVPQTSRQTDERAVLSPIGATKNGDSMFGSNDNDGFAEQSAAAQEPLLLPSDGHETNQGAMFFEPMSIENQGHSAFPNAPFGKKTCALRTVAFCVLGFLAIVATTGTMSLMRPNMDRADDNTVTQTGDGTISNLSDGRKKIENYMHIGDHEVKYVGGDIEKTTHTEYGQSSPATTRHGFLDVVWSSALPYLGGYKARLGKYNSVTENAEDGLVYVTIDNGRLEVLDSETGKLKHSWNPTGLNGSRFVEGRGGVAFGSNEEIGKFVLYSVVFSASASSHLKDASRIFVFSRPDMKPLFESQEILGHIEGTPVVSQNPGPEGGFAYFTHNVHEHTKEAVGAFSIMGLSNANKGKIIFTEKSCGSLQDQQNYHVENDSFATLYGPVAISSSPTRGQFHGGENNQNEIVFWAAKHEDGQQKSWHHRAFQLSRDYAVQMMKAEATKILGKKSWSVKSAPYASRDGKTLIYGTSDNMIRGWTGSALFNEDENLNHELGDRSLGAAIPFTPSVTADGRIAVVTSKGTMNLVASNGKQDVLWRYSGPTNRGGHLFSSPAILSPDEQFLYSSTISGHIVGVRTKDGSEHFAIDCTEILKKAPQGSQCFNQIRASIGLSGDGKRLYFGDVRGNIFALQVAV